MAYIDGLTVEAVQVTQEDRQGCFHLVFYVVIYYYADASQSGSDSDDGGDDEEEDDREVFVLGVR